MRFHENVGRCLGPKLYRDCPHLPVNAVFLPGGGELRERPPHPHPWKQKETWEGGAETRALQAREAAGVAPGWERAALHTCLGGLMITCGRHHGQLRS